MSGVPLLLVGLVIGAGLGLAYARVTKKPAKALPYADCVELLALLRAVEPKLRSLDQVFENWPDAFGVLDEIIAQLRTNGGKTMADAVGRLDRAALVAAKAAELSAQTATQIVNAVGLVDAKVTLGVGAALRSEHQLTDAAILARGVAENLVTAQSAVNGVASDLVVAQEAVHGIAADLEQSHVHARGVGKNAPHGAAADAGSRGGKDPDSASGTDGRETNGAT